MKRFLVNFCVLLCCVLTSCEKMSNNSLDGTKWKYYGSESELQDDVLGGLSLSSRVMKTVEFKDGLIFLDGVAYSYKKKGSRIECQPSDLIDARFNHGIFERGRHWEVDLDDFILELNEDQTRLSLMVSIIVVEYDNKKHRLTYYWARVSESS